MLASVPLMIQYEEVLTRPENLAAFGLNGAHVDALLDALCAVATPVEISYLWRPLLRDPDDELVVEVALHGRADMLLTFNVRDFAGVERYGVVVREPGPAWWILKGDGE